MAIIYLLRPKVPLQPNHQYVGSTTRELFSRFAEHKYEAKNRLKTGRNRICSSKLLFDTYGHANLEMIELERCDDAIRRERERHYYETIDCLNENRPQRTDAEKESRNREYYYENREARLEYRKKYYQRKRDEKLAKQDLDDASDRG